MSQDPTRRHILEIGTLEIGQSLFRQTRNLSNNEIGQRSVWVSIYIRQYSVSPLSHDTVPSVLYEVRNGKKFLYLPMGGPSYYECLRIYTTRDSKMPEFKEVNTRGSTTANVYNSGPQAATGPTFLSTSSSPGLSRPTPVVSFRYSFNACPVPRVEAKTTGVVGSQKRRPESGLEKLPPFHSR